MTDDVHLDEFVESLEAPGLLMEQPAQTCFAGLRLLPSDAGVLIRQQSHAINLQPLAALLFVCIHPLQ